ncbi:hypothetical protein Zm00014a_012985 [Zea mays]|uniref:Uncharacterized protein n=1 Tax=Zea mays TaxID=4577 RepID=A0A3L6E1Y0_MAIZE|nr:hypothetical protein Zm00014a_012985 [Zea mays]
MQGQRRRLLAVRSLGVRGVPGMFTIVCARELGVVELGGQIGGPSIADRIMLSFHNRAASHPGWSRHREIVGNAATMVRHLRLHSVSMVGSGRIAGARGL